jgi:hypothetical protein
MQKSNFQRIHYTPVIIPGETKSAEQQARTLVASVDVALIKKPELPGEFNQGYFQENFASVFNRNAAVSRLRTQRRELLPEARKAFYNFKIVTQELQTPLTKDVEDAVLTIIADKILSTPVIPPTPLLKRVTPEVKKPTTQPVKTEIKKPHESMRTSPVTRTAPPRKKAQVEDAPIILNMQTLLYQQAEKILASALEPIQQKRVQAIGKIPEGFQERFSKIVDNDPSIASIRVKTPEIMPEILKQFRDFQMAVEVLNYQHISDETQHAALSIIINRMIEKPRAPAPQTSIQKSTHEPAKRKIVLTQEQRDTLKAQHKIKKAKEREGLNLIRQMLQEIGKEIRREAQLKVTKLQEARPGLQEISATAFTKQGYAKSLRRAEMIISFAREARAENRAKSFRTRRDYDSPLYDSCNNNADLVTMRAQRPSASFDLEREFRLIVITASRLKPSVVISEPVRQAIISMLVHEAKDKAVRNHERLQDHARNIGRSAASRAAASKTLSAIRNDPVKAAEHNKRASERIKKLYENPEDKSGFRENRKTSFHQQQRDSNGHFIKAEEPILIPE